MINEMIPEDLFVKDNLLNIVFAFPKTRLITLWYHTFSLNKLLILEIMVRSSNQGQHVQKNTNFENRHLL